LSAAREQLWAARRLLIANVSCEIQSTSECANMNQSSEVLMPARKLAKQGKTPFPGESDAYREAREALLAEEIEFRRHMTRLSEQRRSLPRGR